MTETSTPLEDSVPSGGSGAPVRALPARLRLGHAALQALADRAGAEVMHVKGYAVAPGLYRSARHSTDADVLVRPEHVPAFLAELEAAGWEVLTHFETGSAFEHAMSLRHPWWGMADVHRTFPGLDPARGFDLLWQRRQSAEIAHRRCTVPDHLDQVLLIMVHAGRDGARGRQDLAYLRRILSATDRAAVRARAEELGCQVALAAAVGDLEAYRDHPDYLLWQHVSRGGGRLDEWRARYSAARGARAKARVVLSMLRVNRDHLALELGHSPAPAEVRQETVARAALALREARAKLAGLLGARRDGRRP